MADRRTFSDSITEIVDGLRDRSPSYFELNRAAAQIDHLGRLLHGHGWARDREIAACLTSAIAELHTSMELPESARTETTARAIGQLEAARAHIVDDATA
jgi:hypothetical protein